MSVRHWTAGPEYIRVADPALALWCNEDGRPGHRTANMVGSLLVALLGGRAARYVGPIVVTGIHRDQAVSLTADQIEHLLAALRLCRTGRPRSTPP